MRRRVPVYKKPSFLIGAMAVIIILILVLVFVPGRNRQPEILKTATDYVNDFIGAGLPVGNVITYDENTDPNSLLGRPNQYTSRVSFADSRLEQDDNASPDDGSIEVFASKKNAEDRKIYVQAIYAAAPAFSEYMYTSSDGLAILRISYDLSPIYAEEYNAVLEGRALTTPAN